MYNQTRFIQTIVKKEACPSWKKIIESRPLITLETIIGLCDNVEVQHMVATLSGYQALRPDVLVSKMAGKLWCFDHEIISELVEKSYYSKYNNFYLTEIKYVLEKMNLSESTVTEICKYVYPTFLTRSINCMTFISTNGKTDSRKLEVFLGLIDEHLDEYLEDALKRFEE